MKAVSINLYNFAELSETAKEKAIFEGELAAVTHYVGKHPKARQAELKFAGEIYTI